MKTEITFIRYFYLLELHDQFQGGGFKSGLSFIIPDNNLEKWCYLVLIIIFEKFLLSKTMLKRKVIYFLQDSSKKLQAHTYVWSDKNDPNLYGVWDFEVRSSLMGVYYRILHMLGFYELGLILRCKLFSFRIP